MYKQKNAWHQYQIVLLLGRIRLETILISSWLGVLTVLLMMMRRKLPLVLVLVLTLMLVLVTLLELLRQVV
jgi:hypothetical protein